jgi:hypothetical protein
VPSSDVERPIRGVPEEGEQGTVLWYHDGVSMTLSPREWERLRKVKATGDIEGYGRYSLGVVPKLRKMIEQTADRLGMTIGEFCDCAVRWHRGDPAGDGESESEMVGLGKTRVFVRRSTYALAQGKQVEARRAIREALFAVCQAYRRGEVTVDALRAAP